VCGFVTGLIRQISTTELFIQFRSQWNDFVASLSGTPAIDIYDLVARSPFAMYCRNAFDTDIIKACG
jgi:hypothetical protein